MRRLNGCFIDTPVSRTRFSFLSPRSPNIYLSRNLNNVERGRGREREAADSCAKETKVEFKPGSLASIVDIVPNSDTGCVRIVRARCHREIVTVQLRHWSGPSCIFIVSLFRSRCGSRKTRMNVQISGMRRIV